jgi:hypothetical protein
MHKTISAGIVVVVILTAVSLTAQQDTGSVIMKQARKAMGGEQKLAAVKTLSLRATYQREMSMPGMVGGGRAAVVMNGPGAGRATGGQVTGEIEIDVELPGRYIKVDTSTGFMAMTRTEGFDGDRPFADAVSANPGMRVRIDRPTDDPARATQALQRNQAELARLLLGILGSTQTSLPVTYTHAGVAESSDGKADIVDVKGADNFTARLFLDTQSHLPLMLTYMAPEPRIVMATADRRAPADAAERDRLERERKEAEAAPPKVVEYRLFFSDYRQVNGVLLPHRIARGSAVKTTEEWEIKSYKINPSFKSDRFKVS